MKQRVRMLKTQPGVHDGEIHPVPFLEGKEYDIGPNLLDQFIELGVVDLTPEGEEAKSKGDAPANKAKSAAPANKAK